MLSWLNLICYTQYNQSSERQYQMGYSYILTITTMILINLATLLVISLNQCIRAKRLIYTDRAFKQQFIALHGRFKYFRYILINFENRIRHINQS